MISTLLLSVDLLSFLSGDLFLNLHCGLVWFTSELAVLDVFATGPRCLLVSSANTVDYNMLCHVANHNFLFVCLFFGQFQLSRTFPFSLHVQTLASSQNGRGCAA